MAMIYSLSLKTGIVVSDWRLANIIPVFKKMKQIITGPFC
jgi:hypothetical protein